MTRPHLRALTILVTRSAWTGASFAAVMWPRTRQAGVGGRLLSMLVREGWVARQQRGYRTVEHRLNDEGRRLLEVNRAFIRGSQKGTAAA